MGFVSGIAWFTNNTVGVVMTPLVFAGFDATLIRVFDPLSGSCLGDIGDGSSGTGFGQFSMPWDAVQGQSQRLYVGDEARIHVLDDQGKFLSQAEAPGYRYRSLDVFSNGGSDFLYAHDAAGGDGIVDGLREVHIYSEGAQFLNVLGTELLDANNEYAFRTDDMRIYDGCFPDDAASISSVEQVAADGAARVLVRMELPQSATVTLALRDELDSGNTDWMGSVASLDGSLQGEAITIPTIEIHGRHYLLAGYFAPENFERPGAGDEDAGNRPVEFLLSVGDVSEEIIGVLDIVRPPIVFIHGIFSDPDTWTNFPGMSDRVKWPIVHKVDYEGTSGASFSDNVLKVKREFENSWSTDRADRSLAVARYDVVAHSMGNILLRKYANESNLYGFYSSMNAGLGFVNRLLMLNAPHEGSPFAAAGARLLPIGISASESEHSRSEIIFAAAIRMMVQAAMPSATDAQMVAGALDDLVPGSEELGQLPSWQIPNRSYVGRGGIPFLASASLAAPRGTILMAALTTLAIPETAPLLTEHSDLVVLASSQEHGLQAHSVEFDNDPVSGLHLSSTGRWSSAGQIAEAMASTPRNDLSFFASEIPAGGGSLGGQRAVAGRRVSQSPDIVWGSLRVQVPVAAVEYGGTIQVAAIVDEFYSATVEKLTIISNVGGQVFAAPPYQVSIPVESTADDVLRFMAIATTTQDEVLVSDVVQVRADRPKLLALDGFVAEPDVLVVRTGEVVGVNVLSIYGSDEYPIPSKDLSFTVADPSVARVVDGDFIQGLNAGTTEVTVQLGIGPWEASLTVHVEQTARVNNVPRVIVPTTQTACAGANVCVSAAESFDMDSVFGDAIDFGWDIDLDGVYDDGADDEVCFTFVPGVNDVVRVRVEDTAGAIGLGTVLVAEATGQCEYEASCVFDASSSGFAYVVSPTDVAATLDGTFVIADESDLSLLFVTDSCDPIARVSTNGLVDQIPSVTLDGDASASIGNWWPGQVGGSVSTIDVSGYVSGRVFLDLGYGIGHYWAPPLRWVSDGGTNWFFNMDAGENQTIYYSQELDLAWDSTASAGGEIAADAEIAYHTDGSLYVVDHTRVLKLSYSPGSLTESLTWGVPGTGDGAFVDAVDVAVKADGSVLVLDRAEKEIQHFDSLGNHLRTIDLVSILGPGISDPTRFAVTQNDVIALVDAGTSKVVLFELPRIVTDAPPNTTTSTLAVAVDTSMLGASSMRFSVSGLAEHRPFEVGVFDIRGRLVR
ncbi:hypothetical protein DRQ53_12975, partial [bacterium]